MRVCVCCVCCVVSYMIYEFMINEQKKCCIVSHIRCDKNSAEFKHNIHWFSDFIFQRHLFSIGNKAISPKSTIVSCYQNLDYNRIIFNQKSIWNINLSDSISSWTLLDIHSSRRRDLNYQCHRGNNISDRMMKKIHIFCWWPNNIHMRLRYIHCTNVRNKSDFFSSFFLGGGVYRTDKHRTDEKE